jgi:hypothetical protein
MRISKGIKGFTAAAAVAAAFAGAAFAKALNEYRRFFDHPRWRRL